MGLFLPIGTFCYRLFYAIVCRERPRVSDNLSSLVNDFRSVAWQFQPSLDGGELEFWSLKLANKRMRSLKPVYQSMLIRTEIPIDAAGIDRLLRKVFPTGDEADLVQQLREDGLLTLGMVASDDQGQIIGYIAFSPVTVMNEDRQWVGLAPLAVDAAYRRQGLAQRLVYESLDSLNEFSYAAVVVLGDPDYYGRFGFTPAAKYQLDCRWPGCEQAFQIYLLADDALNGVSGLVNYSAPFDSL